MFGSVSQEISDILENEAVTANFHKFCATDQVCIEPIFPIPISFFRPFLN